MRQLLLGVLIWTFLYSPAWAVTDMIHTYDSGGGKDYSSLATWEGDTDAVNFSVEKVLGGISVTSGSFPSDSTLVDDGAGTTFTIVGVKNSSDQVIAFPGSGTITPAVEYCNATDTDCFTCSSVDDIGRVILDAYDSQSHNEGGLTFSGALNQTSEKYRMIRSASGCSTPWSGVETSGAQFIYTGTAAYMWQINENYFTIENIGVKYTSTRATDTWAIYSAQYTRILGCLVYECTNAGAGEAHGIIVFGTGGIYYNTIVRDCSGNGFDAAGSPGAYHAFINCTSLGNGATGFVGDTDQITGLWSCYAANNTTADFEDDSGAWGLSGWNASKDNTSDLGSGAGDNYKNGLDLITAGTMGSDGILTGSTNLSGSAGAGENWGRNPYNDLSASYDFSNFLRNDTAGDDRSKIDIQGDSRPNEDVADSAWHVGADQYVEAASTTSQVIINAW